MFYYFFNLPQGRNPKDSKYRAYVSGSLLESAKRTDDPTRRFVVSVGHYGDPSQPYVLTFSNGRLKADPVRDLSHESCFPDQQTAMTKDEAALVDGFLASVASGKDTILDITVKRQLRHSPRLTSYLGSTDANSSEGEEPTEVTSSRILRMRKPKNTRSKGARAVVTKKAFVDELRCHLPSTLRECGAEATRLYSNKTRLYAEWYFALLFIAFVPLSLVLEVCVYVCVLPRNVFSLS